MKMEWLEFHLKEKEECISFVSVAKLKEKAKVCSW